MSSLTTILKTNKVPSSAYLTNNDEPKPKEEKPVEKPAEGTAAAWNPVGDTPNRASRHGVRGRVHRLFA